MANTLKFGNGQWATKKGSTLAYNDENGNFKPLPFDFDRDTSATRVNKEGLIEVVSNNEPRIDFKDDSKGALLLEPSRSNLITYSEDFTQSNWAKSNVTLTSDFAVAPNGTNTASKILATASDSLLQETISITSGTTYTLSVYLKTVSGNLNTNISLGSPAFPDTQGDGGRTKEIIVTDSWQRFTITSTADATANSGVGVGGFSSFSTGEEILVWGMQLEQGSYATSYIPTQGSIGTRVAESCSDAGNDQVFNDSEGVLFAEISALADDGTAKTIELVNSSNSNNRLSLIYRAELGRIQMFLNYTGATATNISVYDVDKTNNIKIACKYKNNDMALWLNGFEVATSNTGTTSSNIGFSNIQFSRAGTANFYGNTKQIQYFDTALTDAELQALTS